MHGVTRNCISYYVWLIWAWEQMVKKIGGHRVSSSSKLIISRKQSELTWGRHAPARHGLRRRPWHAHAEVSEAGLREREADRSTPGSRWPEQRPSCPSGTPDLSSTCVKTMARSKNSMPVKSASEWVTRVIKLYTPDTSSGSLVANRWTDRKRHHYL